MLHTPLIYSFFYYFSYVTSTVSHRLDYLSNHLSESLSLLMLCSLLKFMRRIERRTRLRWRGEKVWIRQPTKVRMRQPMSEKLTSMDVEIEKTGKKQQTA